MNHHSKGFWPAYLQRSSDVAHLSVALADLSIGHRSADHIVECLRQSQLLLVLRNGILIVPWEDKKKKCWSQGELVNLKLLLIERKYVM